MWTAQLEIASINHITRYSSHVTYHRGIIMVLQIQCTDVICNNTMYNRQNGDANDFVLHSTDMASN